MTRLEILLYKQLYRKSFYEFVKDFWSCVDPAKYVDGNLIKFYCEIFQYMCKPWVGYKEIDVDFKVPDGEDADVIDIRSDKRNINISMPPRHCKSMIFNVFGPVWLWTLYPVKCVSVSHTEGLAVNMNLKRKMLINSERFKELYSEEIILSSNSNSFLKDTRGGELYSINRNALTGYGGDIIINDDLTNAEAARKDKEEMANAWSYYQNTMPSRINDPSKCIIINVQQRLAPNDITGHIMNDLKLASQYIFVVLPAIFKKKTYLICPISGDIITYEVGESLWKERFGDYTGLRFQVGESIFETQYLQNPISSDKTIVKSHMVVEMDECDVPPLSSADMIYSSHDFPVKDKETSDYLGSVLGYKVGSTLYVFDALEQRMGFVKSVNYVKELSNAYPGIIQVIEDKANGSPILQQLQETVSGMQSFQPGTQSKTQRLESATIYMNAGNVVLVRTQYDKLSNTYQLNESMQILKRKLLNFPFLDHDDIVDAFVQLTLFIFMDRKWLVYGRSFNDKNIINTYERNLTYTNVFFNREGDYWKVLEIAVDYCVDVTKLIVLRETSFKASIQDGILKMKEFAPKKTVFIESNSIESLYGLYSEKVSIENYAPTDFEKSVASLQLGLGKKQILIMKDCKNLQVDLDTFKYDKSKDENVLKFKTQKDGFIACLRTAVNFYGGIY